MPGGSVLIVNTDKYWTILTDMDNGSTQLHPFGGAGSSCLRPSPPPCLGKITSPQNMDQKYIKIYQKSTNNLSPRPSWRGLGGSWEALGRLLGVSWGYLGPKSQQVTEKLVRWTPLDPPTWSQNPTKINIKSIKKLVIF